ncbi:MAG: DUF2802 domain-containing protein [Bdellovibrionaceae bacterium]|nr:DUF2802 domain-containing protein [Pseudobdellovibrionaceae bacterium]
MSFWLLLQILVNLFLLAAVAVLWVRLHRPTKEDPRLSKGLQLLEGKIAVLEDLSDRTEVQVKQLIAILEAKIREVQEKIHQSEQQIQRINDQTQRSLEVSRIFQDRIPHAEIIERQKTIKYIKAARMAHEGKSAEEIAAAVDLTMGEIEFLLKVNKDQLMFDEKNLPEWCREEILGTKQEGPEVYIPEPRKISPDLSKAFEIPGGDLQALQKLGEEFKKAVHEHRERESVKKSDPLLRFVGQAMPGFIELVAEEENKETQKVERASPGIQAVNSAGKTVEIRPVRFKKVERP